MNSGVCIKGTSYGDVNTDFYGLLTDVVELEYHNPSNEKTCVVLFKCDWFDPTFNRGWKKHKHYDLVEINTKRRFRKYEPFILASQAQQVYFAEYASRKKDKSDWSFVYKIRAQRNIDSPDIPYQETDVLSVQPTTEEEENENDTNDPLDILHSLRSESENENEIVETESVNRLTEAGKNTTSEHEDSNDEELDSSEDEFISD